jgi:hypothetical protein
MVASSEIQHTRLKGEKTFQEFCLRLIRRYWNDDYAQLHGRRGQTQRGADITGSDRRNGYANAAVQCKGSETNDPRKLTEDELAEEVEKAKAYSPKLDILIVAYAGDRDATLQRKAAALNDENAALGLFKVALWSWDDIVERALDFQDVAERLLVHNKIEVANVLDPRPPKARSPEALENAIRSLVAAASQELVPSDAAGASADPVLEAKIDVWRDQLLEGNGRTIIQPLRDFISGLPSTADPHVRFRAFANLGAALIQDGQTESALVAFDEATLAQPTSAGGLANKARAALLRGRDDDARRAAEEALKVDPNHQLAIISAIQVAPPECSARELEQRFSTRASEIDIGAALARRYAVEKAYEDAVRIARAIAPAGWQRDTIIATNILVQFEEDLNARVGAPIGIDKELLINEAIQMLERAWLIVRVRQDIRNWEHVAANLCASYRLAGFADRADSLASEALALLPKSVPIAQQAILSHIRAGNAAGAKALADTIALDGDSECAMLAANASALANNWSDAAKWARIVFDGTADTRLKGQAAELLLVEAHKKSGPENALALADELRTQFEPNITFESRAAEIARRMGNEPEISAARHRLAEFNRRSLTAIDRVELASAFSDDGEWALAAQLLDGLYNTDRPSEILKRRLFALYRADDRHGARTLYQSLQPPALQSPEIRRLGAAIYERSGMLAAASKELEAAIVLDPLALRSRLDWARLSIRNGEEKKVSKWVKNLKLEYQGEPEDRLELAQLLDRYGRRKDALKLGYSTLSKNWGRSERLHMMFMSLFLLRERADKYLKPKEVAADCVVFIQDDHGGAAHYRIEADAEPASDVLPPEHSFAKLMLGKTVGDSVTLDQGIGPPKKWRIKEIKHKFLDLFHKTIESHETAFPGSRMIGRFHVQTTGDNAFKPIFEQARERAKTVDEATKLYEGKFVPIETIGKILGIDAVEASKGLRFGSKIVIDTCLGTEEERRQTLENIQEIPAFLVDAATLVHWQEIDLLAALSELSAPKFQVVQSTVDVLAARVEEAQSSLHAKGGSLQAIGDKFALVEATATERNELLKSRTEILEWCRANAEIVPTEPLRDIDASDSEGVLTQASADTIGTGRQNGTALAMDDRRLRALADSIGIKTSTWTQALIINLRNKGQISPTDYTKYIAKLARYRIGFVTVGADELVLAADLGPSSAEFVALAEAIARDRVDPKTLIPILVHFITHLWITDRHGRARDRFASEILFRLLLRPDGAKLFRVVITAISQHIKSLPFPLNLMYRWWSGYVETFVLGHFIRSTLLSGTDN